MVDRRAIDLREADEVGGDIFKTLIRAVIALNRSSADSRMRLPGACTARLC